MLILLFCAAKINFFKGVFDKSINFFKGVFDKSINFFKGVCLGMLYYSFHYIYRFNFDRISFSAGLVILWRILSMPHSMIVVIIAVRISIGILLPIIPMIVSLNMGRNTPSVMRYTAKQPVAILFIIFRLGMRSFLNIKKRDTAMVMQRGLP